MCKTDERREEVIEELCSIVGLVYRSQGDYSHASDGFCRRCFSSHGRFWTFQHNGRTLDYVRQAVVRALQQDGFQIAEGFDPLTGKEVIEP